MDKLKLKLKKSTFESEPFFRLLGNLISIYFDHSDFQFKLSKT